MVAAGETVIMKTAMVTINANNVNATTRAFLDSGSFWTYSTQCFRVKWNQGYIELKKAVKHHKFRIRVIRAMHQEMIRTQTTDIVSFRVHSPIPKMKIFHSPSFFPTLAPKDFRVTPHPDEIPGKNFDDRNLPKTIQMASECLQFSIFTKNCNFWCSLLLIYRFEGKKKAIYPEKVVPPWMISKILSLPLSLSSLAPKNFSLPILDLCSKIHSDSGGEDTIKNSISGIDRF